MRACSIFSLDKQFASWIALLALAGAVGCRRSPAPASLTVSAAISLKEPLAEVARGFEQAHPGWRVDLNLGASGDLARQIEAKAPVDAFVSADERTMRRLLDQRLVGPPTVIARNRLVLIARPGALPGLRFPSLASDPRVKRLAIGMPEVVPAGRYAVEVLGALGELGPLSGAGRLVYAGNVRQVLEYVARGDADAGIVYATDAPTSRAVAVVDEAPAAVAPAIAYPAAPVAASAHPAEARDLVERLAGAPGRAALASHGFLPP